MPPRKKATRTEQLGKYVGPLLGLLSVLLSLLGYLNSGAQESGKITQFKEGQLKTDDQLNAKVARVWDAFRDHERVSEAEHRELRRDIEADYRREIDASCGCRTEKRK